MAASGVKNWINLIKFINLNLINFQGAHSTTDCNLCLQNIPQTSSHLPDCVAILSESEFN